MVEEVAVAPAELVVVSLGLRKVVLAAPVYLGHLPIQLTVLYIAAEGEGDPIRGLILH
jgi:hypothetical protein